MATNQNHCRVFDVADTASGTDWIIITHHQFLMHCLQHLNKHPGVPNSNSCNAVMVTQELNVIPGQLFYKNTASPRGEI